MAKVTITTDNPGIPIEIEVSDETVLALFTDMAAVKASLSLLWKVTLAGMAGGFGVLAALVALL